MRNLFLFIRRFYPFFLFLFLEVIALWMVSRANTYQHTSIINSTNRISGRAYESRENITQYFSLRTSNEILKEENASLRLQMSRIQALADSGYVDTIGNNIYDFLPARVINHSIHKRFNYFTLDKGSADGLRRDMGVIDERGLVGMITNISQEYAVGISMLNTKTRISVKHKKSGAIGLLRWTGIDPLKHIIEDITKTARVQVGDTIVTSGYSTFFPEGLSVAVVTKASLLEGSNFYDIEVRLTNDILSLENVYVVSHYHKSEIDSLEMTAR